MAVVDDDDCFAVVVVTVVAVGTVAAIVVFVICFSVGAIIEVDFLTGVFFFFFPFVPGSTSLLCQDDPQFLV